MDKQNYSVYLHTFPNGKHYVGITKQAPEKRWHKGHGYDRQPYMANAIKKYGWDNIYHSILYDGLNKQSAESIERNMITLLKSNNKHFGYNLANGGSSTGTLSIESRKKISESRKGIVFSEEHRRRLSESHKNQKPTKEQNLKNMLNNPNRKRVECVETNIIYNSIREAGRKTGISHKLISSVCNKKYGHKSAGGYTWRFI